MKKFLLCLAAMAAMSVSAQSFKMCYSSQLYPDGDPNSAEYQAAVELFEKSYVEIVDGAVVTVNDLYEIDPQYEYCMPCYFMIENLSGKSIDVSMKVEPIASECTLKVPDGPSFCYPGNCTSGLPITVSWSLAAGAVNKGSAFHLDYAIGGLGQMEPLDLDSDECFGKWAANITVSAADQTIKFKVLFDRARAGVDGINADANLPAAYYNLQGIRIDNPAAGNIYIRRQGSSAVKVLF